MSNPTLLVEQFNGDEGAFTVAGPERYLGWLWLEEGTINVVANPFAATDATNWIPHANVTIERVASLPAPLPDEAGGITTGFRVEVTSEITGSSQILAAAGVVSASAVAHTASWYVYVPAGLGADALNAVITGFTGASGTVNGPVNLADTNAWQRIPAFTTPAGGDLTGAISLRSNGTLAVGKEFWFTCVQMEGKDHATSATTSTRAASSASLTMDEPATVACWYREGYSGAKQFAYLDTLGQLGDYGDISYAAGDLTISTSRNLVIGPFAAFDRALTAKEQANLARTQSWSLSTVFGRNPYINFQLRPY